MGYGRKVDLNIICPTDSHHPHPDRIHRTVICDLRFGLLPWRYPSQSTIRIWHCRHHRLPHRTIVLF